jgi:hypothetical protein
MGEANRYGMGMDQGCPLIQFSKSTALSITMLVKYWGDLDRGQLVYSAWSDRVACAN